MAWGGGGEELRERAKLELSTTRISAYRLRQTANKLDHVEKGPYLRQLVTDLETTFQRIEELLGR
jgi:hypothetical protein